MMVGTYERAAAATDGPLWYICMGPYGVMSFRGRAIDATGWVLDDIIGVIIYLC